MEWNEIKPLLVKLLLAMTFVLPQAALAQEGLPTQPQTADQAGRLPLLVGVGDLLDVAVFDTPELSFKGRVDDHGQITLPVGGKVTVAGLNTVQAGQLIQDQLRTAEIMPASSVTVLDTEYATQGITVMGEVRQPGTYTLLGPHTLYDALSSAGGPTDTEGASITVTHLSNPDKPEVIDVTSPNFSEVQRQTRVYPGDNIFVSKAGMIYVVGDVARPGAYYLTKGQKLSVLNVVALASGVLLNASEKHCSIVRKDGDGAVTIPLNLKKIQANESPDPILIAGDVLVVPHSTIKQVLTTAIPGAGIAVTSSVTAALLVR